MRPETTLSTDNVQAQRIMVIAPHPDDESLGCGGLIALLAAKERKFHIVFVTDGGASHDSPDWPRSRLVAQRQKEAENALINLGLAQHSRSFLKLPDGDFPELASPVGQQAITVLINIISEFQPDLVLLPWRRDSHDDHRASWALTHAALKAAQQTPETLEYTIWLEEHGASNDYPRDNEATRVTFALGKAQQAKRAAVLAHVSQTSPLIDNNFCVNAAVIERLCGPTEHYWKPLP